MWFYYLHHNKGNNHLGRVTIDLLFNTEIKDFLRSDQHISFLTKYLEIKCVKLSINSSKMKIMGTLWWVSSCFPPVRTFSNIRDEKILQMI